MTQPAKPSKIFDTYRAMHPKSAALYERARGVIAGGITHDGRNLKPFPVYIDRALGSRKWDVDGHEYVDYWMGHGALILGHCHPAVVKAIQEQAPRGTHFGACHELEVRWAELVCKLVPSAEMVRFTMSGTEATHLAIRIARAHTGHPKVVKFHGHFHGWHDGVVAAVNPPFDVPMSAGVPSQILDQLLLCPPNDIKAVDGLLQRGEVAACLNHGELGEMRTALQQVALRDELLEYIVEVVRRTRADEDVAVGAGPRATQALLWASRAWAALGGRDFVAPDDVRAVSVPVLEHRLTLRPEAEMEGARTAEVLDRILHAVPVPR